MVTIQVKKSSPSVTFTVVADRSSTNVAGNYSDLYAYIQASKGSANYFLNAGSQVASIDGVGEFGRHQANPFLPQSGPYASGWNEGPYYLRV